MRPALMSCLLVVPALMVGCGRSIPKPPAGVPEKALYAGDGKEGHFIHFESVTQLGWIVKIYDAKSGAVVKSGEYRVQGLARAEVLQEELVRFDGEFIHLKDGSRLAPWKK